MTSKRLSTKQREELYRSEAQRARDLGRGDFPICAICDCPIFPGRLWDENHQAHKPRWLGGNIDGISHRRCNNLNAATYATPLWAKNERIRKRHLDIPRSRTPLPGGRDDRLKKKISGHVVIRRYEDG